MPHITIIGAGFLGSAFALGAADRGLAVTIIGRSDPFHVREESSTSVGMSFITGNGVDHLPKVLRDGTDTIIIAAGGRFPVPSSAEPAADAVGTLSLLIPLCEAVRSISPKTRIIFLSSAGAVYGLAAQPKRESDPAEPTSPYGMSRLVGEQYLHYYRRVHGLHAYSLRCANVYGRLLPESRGQGVVAAVFRSALTGNPFNLHGDGRQVRDFIHVDDLVRGTLDLLDVGRDLPAVINIGCGTGYTISDVVEKVAAVTKTHITIAPGPSAHTDVGSLVVDLSLLRTIIEFKPRDLDAGIELMARDLDRGDPSRPKAR